MRRLERIDMGHLWSWLDIEAVLKKERYELGGKWPAYIRQIFVYSDAVHMIVGEGCIEGGHAFLKEIFGPRYRLGQGIALDGLPKSVRYLPLVMEEDGEAEQLPDVEDFIPQFHEVRFRNVYMEKNLQLNVPIFAFYSFKGGVGRTTHLIASLRAYSDLTPRPALVIDADLEAPGITWLAQNDGFDATPFSFVDFLALLFSDESSDVDAVAIAVQQLRRNRLRLTSEKMEREHFFLPAFRYPEQMFGPYIALSELLKGSKERWRLRQALDAIAMQLEIGATFIDLRAGVSELSSPLLFDPTITRIIVTTLGIQCLEGTFQVLSEVAKIRSVDDVSSPFLVFSQMLDSDRESSEYIEAVDRFSQKFSEGVADAVEDRGQILETNFAQQLLHARSLRTLLNSLETTDIPKSMQGILEACGISPSHMELVSPLLVSPLTDMEEKRAKLASFARACEFAETNEVQSFLSTPQLRALSQRYKETLPIASVIGSKGAGKTFTFLQILRKKFWFDFVADALQTSEKISSSTEIPVIPLTLPANVGEQSKANEYVQYAIQRAVEAGFIARKYSYTKIKDAIREMIASATDDTEGRKKWFRLFAEFLGCSVSGPSPDEELIQILRQQGRQCVLLMDGLEEIFSTIHREGSPNKQAIVLRSLLVDVLAYLQEVPDSPLGLIVFVRSDYVGAAMPQNAPQFERKYESFALQWNDEQALRLALWMAQEAYMGKECLEKQSVPIVDMPRADVSLHLNALWGRNLGSEKSRKAITESWVTAVLSDYRGRIQARDLTRLLRFAAEQSVGTRATDRVLAAQALRDAVLPCSQGKIKDIEQESPELGDILRDLEAQSFHRHLPFAANDLSYDHERIKALIENGIFIEYEGLYYMPEIVRQGLNLQFKKGYRAKVLMLSKRAAGMRG